MNSPDSQIRVSDLRVLANGMAHAIRNPLSSIMTAATLVQEDQGVSEETSMLLGVVLKESRHLNRILADFLEYVKPRETNPIELDLVPIIRGVLAENKSALKLGQGIEVEDRLPESLAVFADELPLHDVVTNLVANAVEAMGDHGKLTISGMSGDTVLVTFEDTGRGLSPRELERAFDPFFSNTSDGTGLGLTIVRATVEAAGGTVAISNRSDEKGACVKVELPPYIAGSKSAETN